MCSGGRLTHEASWSGPVTLRRSASAGGTNRGLQNGSFHSGASSSWGSPVPSKRSAQGDGNQRVMRNGSSTSFSSTARPIISDPEVALAGFRIFVAERMGGWEATFQRMDFHRNNHVSCLEFQEVISGQERYCTMQEARDLFCLLARGTNGWLTWEGWKKRMNPKMVSVRGSHCQAPDVSGVDFNCIDVDGSASWSCLSSQDGCRQRGTTLHSLHLQPLSSDSGFGRKADAEADDGTTLTPRSSRSGGRTPLTTAPGSSTSALSVPPSGISSARASTVPSGKGLTPQPPLAGWADLNHQNNGATVVGGSSASTACVKNPQEKPLSARSQRNARSDQLGSYIPGRRSGWSGAVDVSANLGVQSGRSSEGGNSVGAASGGEAFQMLEAGLNSLRAEVEALNAMRRSGSADVIMDGSLRESGLHSPSTALSPLVRSSLPSPRQAVVPTTPPPMEYAAQLPSSPDVVVSTTAAVRMLPWITHLPRIAQGRIAACRTLNEVLEVLDQTMGQQDHIGTATASMPSWAAASVTDAAPREGEPGLRFRDRQASSIVFPHDCLAAEAASACGFVDAEMATAAADLLKTTQERVVSLEGELESRHKKHEEEVAALRRKHREDRNQTLHRLINRLQPGRASALEGAFSTQVPLASFAGKKGKGTAALMRPLSPKSSDSDPCATTARSADVARGRDRARDKKGLYEEASPEVAPMALSPAGSSTALSPGDAAVLSRARRKARMQTAALAARTANSNASIRSLAE